LWCFSRLEKAVKPVAERLLAAAETRPLSQLSTQDLLELSAKQTEDIHAAGSLHVLVSIYAGAMFTGLGKLCEKFLGDQKGELHGRLCKALPEMESAQPAFELWRLAEIVRKSSSLQKAFARTSGAEILAAIDDDFRARLDAFLQRFGHHSVSPMELSARTWDEDLPTVLEMVRNYLQSSVAPETLEERGQKDRQEATRESEQKLGGLKRGLFRFVLTRCQKWLPTRERSKTMLIGTMHRRRKVVRELGRRLASEGRLSRLEDVFYLRWDELTQLLSTGRDDAQTLVRRRRAEEARNRSLEFAVTFRGRPVPTQPQPADLPAGRALEGIPVSRGVVTGPARVIFDPQREPTLLPGEILVAPVTDAAWGPLFTVAGGLVVDIGGALSHGSTVAREYGIPAVVDVKVGTKVIRTGDVITVDGTRGTVQISEK
jgi:pyruvate,water dikinase